MNITYTNHNVYLRVHHTISHQINYSSVNNVYFPVITVLLHQNAPHVKWVI